MTLAIVDNLFAKVVDDVRNFIIFYFYFPIVEGILLSIVGMFFLCISLNILCMSQIFLSKYSLSLIKEDL